MFKTDEYEVYSRILSGEFINYERVFIDYENETSISRKAFSECLKRALICYGDKQKTALKCSFNDDNMLVQLINGMSEYEETLKLKNAVTAPVEIGFNAKYLLEAAGSFKEDELKMQLGSPVQPVIVSGQTLKALIQPVRL